MPGITSRAENKKMRKFQLKPNLIKMTIIGINNGTKIIPTNNSQRANQKEVALMGKDRSNSTASTSLLNNASVELIKKRLNNISKKSRLT